MARTKKEKAIVLEAIDLIPWENIEIVQDRASTPKEDKELTESIRNLQLIHPITLLDLGDGKYKVAAGKRRAVSLKKIFPEGLRKEHFHISTNDSQVLAYAENSIRKNFTLREEIEHLRKIREDNPDMPIKVIADKLGRSVPTISRRLAISTLPDEYLEWLDDPDIRLDRMEELALLNEEEREDVSKYECCSSERLDRFAYSMPEGGICDKCDGCEHNTATDALFDDEWICTNGNCYRQEIFDAANTYIEFFKKEGDDFIVVDTNILLPDLDFRKVSYFGDYNKGEKPIAAIVVKIGSLPTIERWQVSDNFLRWNSYQNQMHNRNANTQELTPQRKLDDLKWQRRVLFDKRDKKILEAGKSIFFEKSNYDKPEEFLKSLDAANHNNFKERLIQIMFNHYVKCETYLMPIKDISATQLNFLSAEDVRKLFDRAIGKCNSISLFHTTLKEWGYWDFMNDCEEGAKTIETDPRIAEVENEIKKLEKEIAEEDKDE